MSLPNRPGWYPDPADPAIEWHWTGREWGESRSRKPRTRTRVIVCGLIGGLLGYVAFSIVNGFGSDADHDLPEARPVPIETLIDRAQAPLDDGGDRAATSACISVLKARLGHPIGTTFAATIESWPAPRSEAPENETWVVSGEYATPDPDGGRQPFRCEVTWDAATEQMTAEVILPDLRLPK